MAHIPVLYHEVLSLLQPQPHGRYIDGTLGAAGHTIGILKASAPHGRVLAFDRDPDAIAYAQQQLGRLSQRAALVQASFAEMGKIAPQKGFSAVDGILLDLGLSSRQLADARRGFSFMQEGPLDMRFDPSHGQTAADLINNLAEEELADLFWRYGEERRSRRMARLIVANRPIHTTTQLADLILQEVGRRGRIHPATQIFQALRIAVNEELAALQETLPTAVDLLRPGGRLVVISFHSLEDRMVKQFFRRLSQDCVCPPEQPVCTCDGKARLKLVTRKAVKASPAEIEANPRSRSARLRAVERVRVGECRSV